jgi:hypothetical protein
MTRTKQKQRAPAAQVQPQVDTLGLVPLLGMTPDMLITSDGKFVVMYEFPTLDLGAASEGYGDLMNRYYQAIGKFPPGFRFQVTVLTEPCSAEHDLGYFMEKSTGWSEQFMALEGDSPENVVDPQTRQGFTAKALYEAGLHLTEMTALWFDYERPLTWRMIITLFYQAPFQTSKGIFGPSTASARLDSLLSQANAARTYLEEKVGLLLAAFDTASISLRPLTAGEMCQVVWRGLHPAAAGDPRASAVDAARSMASRTPNAHRRPPAVELFEPTMETEKLCSLLAPDVVAEQPEYLEVDGVYVAAYVVYDFISGRPAYMHRLSTLTGGFIGSIHIEVADALAIAHQLKQRETHLKASQLTRARQGRIADFSSGMETDSVEGARHALETAGQSPLFIRFVLLRTAPSLEELHRRRREMETVLATLGVSFFHAKFTQMPAWLTTLPLGKLEISQKPRNMNPAAMMTFVWPPVKRLWEGQGVYIGIDDDTRLPVMLDMFGGFKERTPTFLALGRPGAGKSVWLRGMMLSALLQGSRVMAIDLEEEMKSFCRAFGGRYIDIGRVDGERINVLELSPDAEDPLAIGVERLIAFLGTLMDRSIDPGPEWNALSEAYVAAVSSRVALDDPSTWTTENSPRLIDILRILQRMGEVGRSLAEMLKPYAEGIYARYFNVFSTVNIRSENLVVFGLKNIHASGDSEVRLRLYLWQIMGLLWAEALRRNMEEPEVANHIFMDEVWALLAAPNGGIAIENMARRLRKRHAALWMATQQVDEFLTTSVGQNIIKLVGNTLIMEQTEIAAKEIGKVFGLSLATTSDLHRMGTGRGILHLPRTNRRIHYVVPKTVGVIET